MTTFEQLEPRNMVADLLILGPADLLGDTAPLVAARVSEGYCVRIAAVDTSEAARHEIIATRPEYALLIGPIESPILWAHNEPVPSDCYFAHLGEWDGDGDGRLGDAVDLSLDVHVGRCPAETPEQVAKWVAKTLRYQNRWPALTIGEYVWEYHTSEILAEVQAITGGRSLDGADEQLMGAIHMTSVVNHAGHGPDWLGLSDERPTGRVFVYTQACLGAPLLSDLVRNTAVVGGVAPSGYGYETINTWHQEVFWREAYDGAPTGQANTAAKQYILEQIPRNPGQLEGPVLESVYGLNLIGDPTMQVAPQRGGQQSARNFIASSVWY